MRLFLISLISLFFLGCQFELPQSKSPSRVGDTAKTDSIKSYKVPEGSTPAWREYVEAKQSGKAPVIPDYSYTGYKYGEEAISYAVETVFNVTDYGAVPNDGKSDQDAIQNTIKAAEKAGGGIVKFPVGRFLVCAEKGIKQGLVVEESNIVIKGSGSGEGGTEVFMANYLSPKDPTKKWSTPPLFKFKARNAASYLNSSGYKRDESKVLTRVSASAAKGTFSIEVADATKLAGLEAIAIRMVSPEATKKYLQGVPMRPIWSAILEKGLTFCEKHQIDRIEGNTVFFKEPLHCDVDSEFTWDVYDYPLAENWGVEDIFFRGNFQEKFKHHKNFIHDSGWTIINMGNAKNSWIRRCRIADVSQGFGFSGCMASSMLHNVIEGNSGHGNFSSNFGYGCLIGLSIDRTNRGSFHGPNTSHLNTGLVVWRYSAEKGAGPDFHAYCPHTTLWDCTKSYIMNNGGSYTMQPNHLWDLTWWNFQQTGKAREGYDFWGLPETEEDKKHKYFGGAKILKPHIIGFHGSATTFNEASLGVYESHGKKVFPESLYEAQLEFRLGYLPRWVTEAKQEWSEMAAK